MKLSTRQLLAIGSFLIISLFITIIFFRINISQNTLNFLGVFGTFASIFGIVITYIQILSVKEINNITQQSIKTSLIKLNQILSISDISKAVKITHEVQNYIVLQNFEPALLRMRDLKSFLIQIKYNEDLKDIIETTNYNKLVKDLGINIANVNDLMFDNKSGINFSKVNGNLIDIETLLSDLENKLKFITHDT